MIIKTFEKYYKDIYEDLLYAVDFGDVNKVKKLIELKKPSIETINKFNGALIFTAAGIDSIDIVIELTNAGASWLNLNSANKYFIDYLTIEQKRILKTTFPIQYKEYLLNKDTKKYNL